jgi:hypothetical protein
MGAPTAMATVNVTVSACREGLPKHRGRAQNQQNERPRPNRPGFKAIPLAKAAVIRLGKRCGNYTVMTAADDHGGHDWLTWGHLPCSTAKPGVRCARPSQMHEGDRDRDV